MCEHVYVVHCIYVHVWLVMRRWYGGGGASRGRNKCVWEREWVCVSMCVCVCAHHRNSQKRCRIFCDALCGCVLHSHQLYIAWLGLCGAGRVSSLPLVIVPGHSAGCGATVISSLFHHRCSLPLVIVPGHSAGCGVTVISGLLSLYWNLWYSENNLLGFIVTVITDTWGLVVPGLCGTVSQCWVLEWKSHDVCCHHTWTLWYCEITWWVWQSPRAPDVCCRHTCTLWHCKMTVLGCRVTVTWCLLWSNLHIVTL